MAETTYEGMFLLDSNKYSANSEAVAREVLGLLEKAGAKVLASRPWQEGRLAYPIAGHRKGLYFLTYFSMESRQLHEVTRLVKFHEAILRHLVIKLDPALIAPMLAMASGHGDVVSSFKDPEAEPAVVAAVAVDVAT